MAWIQEEKQRGSHPCTPLGVRESPGWEEALRERGQGEESSQERAGHVDMTEHFGRRSLETEKQQAGEWEGGAELHCSRTEPEGFSWGEGHQWGHRGLEPLSRMKTIRAWGPQGCAVALVGAKLVSVFMVGGCGRPLYPAAPRHGRSRASQQEGVLRAAPPSQELIFPVSASFPKYVLLCI